MSEQRTESNRNYSTGWERASVQTWIPIQSAADFSPVLDAKTQPIHSMNATEMPKKSLIPALFQIASRADDAESVRALREELATKKTSLGETMLDAKRLEGILKALGKKKKPGTRRTPSIRFEKRLSLNGGAIA